MIKLKEIHESVGGKWGGIAPNDNYKQKNRDLSDGEVAVALYELKQIADEEVKAWRKISKDMDAWYKIHLKGNREYLKGPEYTTISYELQRPTTRRRILKLLKMLRNHTK